MNVVTLNIGLSGAATGVTVRGVRAVNTDGEGLHALGGEDFAVCHAVGGGHIILTLRLLDELGVYVHVTNHEGDVQGWVLEPLEGENHVVHTDLFVGTASGAVLVSQGEHAAVGGAHAFLANGASHEA